MLTRIFKSGNSLAVRIPKELNFGEPSQDVEIQRKGDCLVIRPVEHRSLAAAIDAFAAFPEGFMAEGRGLHEQTERAWD